MRGQRSDYYKSGWSDSVSVSLLGSWRHERPRAWAVSATPGYDDTSSYGEVTFAWTVPISADDLARFGDASVQIAWWETSDGVPERKQWLNVTSYGQAAVSGTETVQWWKPLTDHSYQVAYRIGRSRFVQTDTDGAEVTNTFTTLAAPDWPPAPDVFGVKAGDAKIRLCWEPVVAAPPVSNYEYRFFSITAGTPEHTDEGDWQTAASTAISKEISGLTNGSVYIAQIRAVNPKGYSDYDNWQQATPTAGATAPTC